MRPRSRSVWLICLALPTDGARRCAACCGRTPNCRSGFCRRGRTLVDLQVPCTFDFNVAATKYFEGLTDGEIPLQMLFSGTVFYALADSPLQVAPISWEQEARFKLPVKLWREMMDTYYPNSVWINLRRDIFERLYHYKMQHGIPTWEQALEQVLAGEEAVSS